MIDNMKQQQQQKAAPTATVAATQTASASVKTLPTISTTGTGMSPTTSMPAPQYKNVIPGSGSGLYVSRVSNIHISRCTKTVRPYVPLKCSMKDGAAVNKRLRLDSSVVPTIMNKQVHGLSQAGPRFVAVRRGDSGTYCPDKIGYRTPIWPRQSQQQPRLSTTTSSGISSTPQFATTLIISSPPQLAAPCNSTFQGPGSAGMKNKEFVQEHKERRHMKAINDAFHVLRRALPWVGVSKTTVAAEQRRPPLGTSAAAAGFSKINTINLAVRYIRALEHLLEDDSEDEDRSSSSSKTRSSSQSSSCNSSPSLSLKSLCSVGSSDFSDLFSITNSIEDLDALDELVSLSSAGHDVLMADTNEKLTT